LDAALRHSLYRSKKTPLALGLFLASKQYNFLALPFIGYLVRPFSWKAYRKLLLQSLGVALATVLPFAIWNFQGLWHDLVLNVFVVADNRQDALSFAIRFPLYVMIGRIFLLAFVIWAARRGVQHETMFAAAYGMALMLFFSASKLAYLNYYFLIGFALWLTAASLWPVTKGQMRETELQVTVT
jgi:Ca2+/Na+ antiporter